jgi:hypothetical protein
MRFFSARAETTSSDTNSAYCNTLSTKLRRPTAHCGKKRGNPALQRAQVPERGSPPQKGGLAQNPVTPGEGRHTGNPEAGGEEGDYPMCSAVEAFDKALQEIRERR